MSPRMPVLLVCSFLLAPLAYGQMELVFKLDHSELLELEPIPAVVTLSNQSTQPLHRGTDYLLSFDVQGSQGVQIKMRNDKTAWVPAELAPGATATFTNDLSYLYKIDASGPYTVAARLQLPKRALVSEKVFLDVMPGAELVHVDGVAPDGSTRRYSLRQLSRAQLNRLFLRVDDVEGSLCYGVIDLGRFVPLKAPALRVDKQGLVHVLHLTAPTHFLHSVFSPNGELVAQQTHDGDASSVRLEADVEAGFRVEGVGVSEPRDPIIETLPKRKLL